MCAFLWFLHSLHYFWCHFKFLGLFLYMGKKPKHWKIFLVLKILSEYLALLLGFIRSAIIPFPFWTFLKLFLLCLGCKNLGILQDGIEVIECWLLNNLRVEDCFLFTLTAIKLLNSRLKWSISENILIWVELSKCVSRNQCQICLQTLPYDLCTFASLAFFTFFFLAFDSILFSMHFIKFEGFIKQFKQ